MLSLQPITLADLLLSRLLFADVKGMTISDFKRALKAIAGSELSNSAFTEPVREALTRSSEQDYVQPINPARYQITDTGRQYILNQLKLKELPPKLPWKNLKNIDWIAYALNLPKLSTDTRKHLADADGLRAVILKHGFDLPVEDFPTLTQARNAVLWQQVCNPDTAKQLQGQLPELCQQGFHQGVVMDILLNHLLQLPKPLPWEKAVPQLVTKIVNARRTDPDELRLAILRQASAKASTSSIAPSIPEANTLEAAQPIELTGATLEKASGSSLTDAEFAEITLNAAQETQDGRLGDYKVFISRVWETLQQQHPDLRLTLDDFKQRLIMANQQQQLTLSRADMAHALNPEDVSASEINHLNSTFHFIYLD